MIIVIYKAEILMGVMIVASPQGFEKKSYRKLKQTLDTRDDCAMMQEVLRRRLGWIISKKFAALTYS